MSKITKETGKFENDVKMYGIQTEMLIVSFDTRFENDVKMYGIQTCDAAVWKDLMFENDVKMYGIQTCLCCYLSRSRLRMM